MSNTYAQQMFQATGTIVNQALSQVKFDETIVCTIQEVFKDDRTKYWVSNGSINFYAYRNDDSVYVKGAQVYVMIPLGDYSQRKIITGKYSSGQSVEQKVSLLDSFLPAMKIDLPLNEKLDQSKYNRSLLGTLSYIKVDFNIGGWDENDETRFFNYSLMIKLYLKIWC